MTSQTHSSGAPVPDSLPTPQHRATVQLPSTGRGAHLARHLTVEQLTQWGLPADGEASWSASLVVAELAANAVRHGHLPGRDFQLALTLTRTSGDHDLLRIEVSDARAEHGPCLDEHPSTEAESGRGLLIVNALATRWGDATRRPAGKTVWYELPVRRPDASPPD
jgi:two-component sensor histidine kinase